VVHDEVLVRRRIVYGRRVGRGTSAPLRWADSVIRAYTTTAAGQSCHVVSGRRASVAESILAKAGRDELPPALIVRRHRTSATAPTSESPPVPAYIPAVRPERTLRGQYLTAVLSREEWDLYAETWREWSYDHPEYLLSENSRTELATICMTTVLGFRILSVIRLMNFGNTRLGSIYRLYRMYNSVHRRQERARAALTNAAAPFAFFDQS
jgi:hypothetical protein